MGKCFRFKIVQLRSTQYAGMMLCNTGLIMRLPHKIGLKMRLPRKIRLKMRLPCKIGLKLRMVFH
jgi:hypothetical protein